MRGSLVTFSLLRSSLFGMVSLAMTISSSLWKLALILVLNGVAGVLPVVPFLASHYFRSLHVPSSLYIDDRHTGEIQLSPLVPGYASLSSALAKSLARANSANFIICFTVITLRYFLGIKKSIFVPRQIVPFLGFLVGSIRQSFSLLRRRSRNSFPFYMLFLTPLLLLSSHFIVYRASVYRFLWQFRELVFPLTRCIMLLG